VKWVQLLLLTPEQRHPMVVGYVPLLSFRSHPLQSIYIY
jgi:hypothetical protein